MNAHHSNDSRRCLASVRGRASAFATAVAAVALTGCASTSHGFGAVLMVSVFLFAVSSCLSGGETTDETGDDVTGTAGRDNVGGTAGTAGAGTWGRCCINGVSSSCHCPPGWACNFGWYETHFPDGTCCTGTGCGQPIPGGSGGHGGGGEGGTTAGTSGEGGGGEGGATAGTGGTSGSSGSSGSGNTGGGGEGGSGYWGQCCLDGVLSDCYCPPNSACNFGMGGACGDGGPGGGGLGGGGAGAGDSAGGTLQ